MNVDRKNGDSLGGSEQLKEEDINEIDEKDLGISWCLQLLTVYKITL